MYVDRPSLPGELGRPFELAENCRNTVRIANHCAEIAGYESKCRDGAPKGDDPEFLEVASLAEAFKEAGKRVRALCMPNLGGLDMSQVAVLAPGFTERQWPAHFDTIPLTKSFEQWSKGECALIASWSRFKGLEADAIVIIELSTDDGVKSEANRYVAHSRAKHLLFVITVSEL